MAVFRWDIRRTAVRSAIGDYVVGADNISGDEHGAILIVSCGGHLGARLRQLALLSHMTQSVAAHFAALLCPLLECQWLIHTFVSLETKSPVPANRFKSGPGRCRNLPVCYHGDCKHSD
jgi:hypothetical protein